MKLLSRRSLCLFFSGIIFFMAGIQPAAGQPFPPINVRVESYSTFNRIIYAHHPLQTVASIANYLICRSTVSGAEVQIATRTATQLSFDDNTAGWSYGQEFFYTVRTRDTSGLISSDSEEVWRFLPKVGLTGSPMTIQPLRDLQYGSWPPYLGQWTHTYTVWRTAPRGGTNVGAINFYNQRPLNVTQALTLAASTTWYLEVGMGRPDWWGTPSNTFWTSWSTSLPFFVPANAPFEDNASSTYFNNSQNRVMAIPDPAGGVRPISFSNSGGGFWRYRLPIAITPRTTSLSWTDRVNAPCRFSVAIPAGQLPAGRSAAEIRVANELGQEVPASVMAETTAGPWVHSVVIHALANQRYNETVTYWVYWGNSSAAPPANPWTYGCTRTSQWEYSPWYSRQLVYGTTETFGTRFMTSPSPADEGIERRSLPTTAGYPTFPFFDYATNTVHVSTNGYLCVASTSALASYSQPINTWNDFIGNPAHDRITIAPFWFNLMINGTVPTNAGLYEQTLGGGTTDYRRLYTWSANRFVSPNEMYVFQVALFRFGDITFRYDVLNYNALWDLSFTPPDNPLNATIHHTAGISRGDGVNWLSCTDGSRDPKVSPLVEGTNRNLLHFFQSCHAFTSAAVSDPTNQTAAAPNLTSVAHYDSRIFDARSDSPTWASFQYWVTGGGGAVDLYVRTSSTTTFPAWNLAHRVATEAVAAGGGPLTLPAHRYLQYRAVFKKRAVGDAPSLDRIRFDVGFITINSTSRLAVHSDVSQGQTFPASMTITNDFSSPLTITVASLTFSPVAASATFERITPLPLVLNPGSSTTIGFLVTIATTSGNLNGYTYINGYVQGTDGLVTLSDNGADTTAWVVIRSRANLVIDQVNTAWTQVNKGQGGIDVRLHLRNTGYVPLRFHTASLTFDLGSYLVNLVSPASGTIINGGGTAIATFSVTVLPESPSGLAFINGLAWGESTYDSALKVQATTSALLDSWVVQNPASLAIGLVTVPPIVYRGQANVPVDVEVFNVGETEASVGSTPLFFSLGSYTEVVSGSPMPATLPGNSVISVRVLVSLAEESPTGTAQIDAGASGTDAVTGGPLSVFGAAQPGQWLIQGEKILTYKDASFLYPAPSFTRPDSGTSKVFAKAENLAPLKEYAIRFLDPDGLEIGWATVIGFGDASGTLVAELTIDNTFAYGIYTVRITNPLNTYSPAQTNFAIVTSASATAEFAIPSLVSLGQVFPVKMTVSNTGGAGAIGIVPSALVRSGTGTATQLVGPIPASLDLPGYGTGTFTWNFQAVGTGTFAVEGSGQGFDGNSDAVLPIASVTSSWCLIQTPAVATITALTATPTLVYRNQKNIPIELHLRNTGEATARITNAQILFTPAFGTYTVASPTSFPFLVAGNSSVVLRVFINVNSNAAAGPATMTGRIWFEDVNNPVSTMINGGIATWTIAGSRVWCYRSSTYTNEQYSFNTGQTLYARGTDLPANTSVRMRFYDSLEPFPPTTPGLGILTPLNTGTGGIVEHFFAVPVNTATLSTWLIVIDDGDDATVGNILAVQNFNVHQPATFTTSLTFDRNSCFLGDIIPATLTVTNISTSTNAQIRPNAFTISYAPGSVGSLTLYSGPVPGVNNYLLPPGESRSFAYTLQAVADSGLSGASTAIRLAPGGGPQKIEINTVTTTNLPLIQGVPSITVYRKALDLASSVWDFGTVDPGSTSLPLFSKVSSTGNHALPIIDIGAFSMRKSITESIPGSYLSLNPATPFSLATTGWVILEARFGVPPNQPPGVYIATMAMYEDHNNTGFIETSDPYDLVFSTVTVATLARAIIVNDEIDFGIVEPGTWSASESITFVGVGNQPIAHLRFEILPDIAFVPANPGPLALDGVGSATVRVYVPPAQPAGVYSVDGVLFNDADFNGVRSASESFDTVRLKWWVGTQSLTLTPAVFDFGFGTPTWALPTRTTQVGNSGQIPLTHLRAQSTVFTNQDQPGTVATDDVALQAPARVNPGLSEIASTNVYVPGGTGTGTYLATFTWFEDLTGDQILDPHEPRANGTARFEVKEFYQLYPLQGTIDLGGVRAGTSKLTSFSYRNAGSLPIPAIRGGITDLTKGSDILSAGQLSVVPAPAPGLTNGAIGTAELRADVPASQPYGVYWGKITIYGDIDLNGAFDPDEPWCSCDIRLEVGDQDLQIINPPPLSLSGPPAQTTPAESVSVKNTGTLTLNRTKGVVTDLIGPGDPIASSALVFVPSPLIGNLLLGQTKTVAVQANVPWGQTAGVYTGTLWMWEDGDNDGIRHPLETAASIPLALTVTSQKVLQLQPNVIDLGYATRNDVLSASLLAQNIGNAALSDPRWHRNPLVSGGNSIPTSSLSILPNPLPTMATPPVGLPVSEPATLTVNIPTATPDLVFQGISYFFEDDHNPLLNLYDPGMEPAASLTIRVQVVTPLLSVAPATINLPAGNPATDSASAACTVTNSGLINLVNLKSRITDLTKGADSIPSSSVTILPALPVTMVPGQVLTASISVHLGPFWQPPGVYSGQWTIWDDRNHNDLIDAWEFAAIAPVQATVLPMPRLDILPTTIDAGKIARAMNSLPLIIGFRNTGNVDLSGLAWSASALQKPPDEIPAASLSFTFFQSEPILPTQYATAQLIIGPIDKNQPLGVYGPQPQILFAGSASDQFDLVCEIIPGGPQGLGSGSVWQEIPTSTYPLAPDSADFMLSAYVCPGTGSAEIGMVMTDEIGMPVASFAILLLSSGETFSHPAGLLGGAIALPAGISSPAGGAYPWYRLYLKFPIGFDASFASSTYLYLRNTSPTIASYSVWFDGVQFERCLPGQMRPTTYSPRQKVISPNSGVDLTGQSYYWEW